MSRQQRRKNGCYNKIAPYKRYTFATSEIQAQNCPKSKFYRTELEPYIGKTIKVSGILKQAQKKKYGGYYGFTSILLKKVLIENNKSNKPIDHLWILCDRYFLRDNHYKINDRILCIGRVYQYQSSGKRNLSICLYDSEKLNK